MVVHNPIFYKKYETSLFQNLLNAQGKPRHKHRVAPKSGSSRGRWTDMEVVEADVLGVACAPGIWSILHSWSLPWVSLQSAPAASFSGNCGLEQHRKWPHEPHHQIFVESGRCTSKRIGCLWIPSLVLPSHALRGFPQWRGHVFFRNMGPILSTEALHWPCGLIRTLVCVADLQCKHQACQGCKPLRSSQCDCALSSAPAWLSSRSSRTPWQVFLTQQVKFVRCKVEKRWHLFVDKQNSAPKLLTSHTYQFVRPHPGKILL